MAAHPAQRRKAVRGADGMLIRIGPAGRDSDNAHLNTENANVSFGDRTYAKWNSGEVLSPSDFSAV
jgi:hypothetical protein